MVEEVELAFGSSRSVVLVRVVLPVRLLRSVNWSMEKVHLTPSISVTVVGRTVTDIVEVREAVVKAGKVIVDTVPPPPTRLTVSKFFRKSKEISGARELSK